MNEARWGTFTYIIRDGDNHHLTYKTNPDLKHIIKFEIPLEQLDRVDWVPGPKAGIQFKFTHSDKLFPVIFLSSHQPTFQFASGDGTVSDIILSNDPENQDFPRINATTSITRSGDTGSIRGIHGVNNSFIINATESIEEIVGGDLYNDFFLYGAPLIVGLKGGVGNSSQNRIIIMDSFYPGEGLVIDPTEEDGDVMSIATGSGDFVVLEMTNIGQILGSNGTESVTLSCEMNSIDFVEVVNSPNKERRMRIQTSSWD